MQLNNISDFKEAIDAFGYTKFWDMFINAYLSIARPDLHVNSSELKINATIDTFAFDNIGNLYEIALEHINRISKKELGQYYTPKDVCIFMADKLLHGYSDSDNLADVCCGTGNLIIEVLSRLDEHKVRDIIFGHKLHLYDLDPTATKLATMKIGILYAEKYSIESYKKIVETIDVCNKNYLGNDVMLPADCFVISNPPYGRISQNLELWDDCTTGSTRDMYSVFMEKIAQQAKRTVIITPQSFLGGRLFAPLRTAIGKYGGEVYSFDNVPSPLFSGRKKGVFNTNTSNSVRAAITLIDSRKKGFRTTPLIRFKSEERGQLFEGIEKLLGTKKYSTEEPWAKIPKTLEPLTSKLQLTKKTVSDYIEKDVSKQKPELRLSIPSTPRYYISAVSRDLDRTSKIIIYAKDEKSYDLLYLLINSTISYLWWRMLDGSITLGRSTLLSLPFPELSHTKTLHEQVHKYKDNESRYLVNKLNAGRNNENVKFPPEIRKAINSIILKQLGLMDLSETLYSIHSGSFIEYSKFWK